MDEPMLQFFGYDHLKGELQEHSKPFGDLARRIVRPCHAILRAHSSAAQAT
jgi:hypothetical protein